MLPTASTMWTASSAATILRWEKPVRFVFDIVNSPRRNQKDELIVAFAKTPVKGLYFNCGWGTGGFKATPGSGWAFAHTIARDEPHALNAAFTIDRFHSGALIDEHGAAGVAH